MMLAFPIFRMPESLRAKKGQAAGIFSLAKAKKSPWGGSHQYYGEIAIHIQHQR